MDVSLFDFDLPEECIALRPASPRDSARMLVVRSSGQLEHRFVRDLPDYLAAGDVLVVNDTKVIAARLHGHRMREGLAAKIEILLHRRLSPCRFSALARPARKLLPGDALEFGALRAVVAGRGEGGEVEVEFKLAGAALDAAIAADGAIPLPPYIAGKRQPDICDATDYQTTYARVDGSVAAPTAGLHFTTELLAKTRAAGVFQEAITLHVGLGTFLPVTVADTVDHRMHAEFFCLGDSAAQRLNIIRKEGGRLLAVGTTTLRALESAASP
ncbi:MAG TPA: S-adenosylmethionine:tRNA ribosyltransferase-isomerase, partial [Rhizomicrobium sp.]|nr:S-adenosylmethionine:tRNA ribosyltransferase-isomerase [Rhizomicrobium sp.]